jgi:hypothetical protein
MEMRTQAASVIFALVLTAGANCQTLEEGWSGIKPLETKKSVVEEKLGRTKLDAIGPYYDYDGNKIVIRANYSTSPCMPVPGDPKGYRIPKDTVLDYVVYFNNPTLLSEIKFDGDEYTKQLSVHRPDDFILLNEEKGIMIVGYVRNDVVGEYIDKIYFRPSRQVKAKLSCKK